MKHTINILLLALFCLFILKNDVGCMAQDDEEDESLGDLVNQDDAKTLQLLQIKFPTGLWAKVGRYWFSIDHTTLYDGEESYGGVACRLGSLASIANRAQQRTLLKLLKKIPVDFEPSSHIVYLNGKGETCGTWRWKTTSGCDTDQEIDKIFFDSIQQKKFGYNNWAEYPPHPDDWHIDFPCVFAFADRTSATYGQWDFTGCDSTDRGYALCSYDECQIANVLESECVSTRGVHCTLNQVNNLCYYPGDFCRLNGY